MGVTYCVPVLVPELWLLCGLRATWCIGVSGCGPAIIPSKERMMGDERWHEVATKLCAALSNLCAEQNGPPLIRKTQAWKAAMWDAHCAIKFHDAVARADERAKEDGGSGDGT